jgi:hypothetical protein
VALYFGKGLQLVNQMEFQREPVATNTVPAILGEYVLRASLCPRMLRGQKYTSIISPWAEHSIDTANGSNQVEIVVLKDLAQCADTTALQGIVDAVCKASSSG